MVPVLLSAYFPAPLPEPLLARFTINAVVMPFATAPLAGKMMNILPVPEAAVAGETVTVKVVAVAAVTV